MNSKNVCRCCLSTKRQVISLNSHSDLTQKTHLECLRLCTLLHVPDQDDDLPMGICLRCSKALQISYCFITRARESEEKLLEAKANVSDEVELVHEWTDLTAAEEKVNNAHHKFTEFNDYFGEFLKTYDANHKSPEETVEICAFGPNTNSNWDSSSCLNSPIMSFIPGSSLSRLDEDYKINSDSKDLLPNILDSFCSEDEFSKSLNLETSIGTVDNPIGEQLKVEIMNNMQFDENFNEVNAFKNHEHRHSSNYVNSNTTIPLGITPLRCSKCNFVTCYMESLRKHYKKAHNTEATNDMLQMLVDPSSTSTDRPYNEISFRCRDCSFHVAQEHDLEEHVVREHPTIAKFRDLLETVYNCRGCHRSFKSRKSMSIHYTMMHTKSQSGNKNSAKLFACEHCQKQFELRASLVLHKRVCSLREAVSCYICQNQFNSMRKFESHLRAEHNVETIYECEVCGKAFSNPQGLAIHQKRHSKRHFQCEFCPRNYINNAELKLHMRRIHGEEMQSIATCDMCYMSFTQQALLRRHQIREHCRKSFKCSYCDYQSVLRCNMRLHQFQHTGKPYKCNICHKEFAMRKTLRSHALKSHSVHLGDEELAAMFRKKFGYPSRFDAFSKTNNKFEITDVSEKDIKTELKEHGLNFENIVKELFADGHG